MSTSECSYGFQIDGPCWGERRLVLDVASSLAGHEACDVSVWTGGECYLSMFAYPDDFMVWMEERGSVRGYSGPCWSNWVWWDIDRAKDLERAQAETLTLARYLTGGLDVPGELVLTFFSGAKGFHVGIPTSLWRPRPSMDFNRFVRAFCTQVANACGVCIDEAVYDRVRAFRAPNSLHPKTKKFKRLISLPVLEASTSEDIKELSSAPAAFDLPAAGIERMSVALAGLWAAASDLVPQANAGNGEEANTIPPPTLYRATLEFIREGACEGERAVRLFAAAANLAQCECPFALVNSLLEGAALDSGLSPSEVQRQIECGFQRGRKN